jgi:carbonic anhydrase
MDRRQALKLLAGLAACPVCASAGWAADWSYEGATGPDHWGDVDAASRVCASGNQQSPVDIGSPIKAQLPALKINWAKRVNTIVNNGHTIQLDVADSVTTSGINFYGPGGSYQLMQFHFHHPSEHLIGGKSFPMEAHFVHANAGGDLAVIGVLMTAGRANKAFNQVVSTMPDKAGPAVKADAAVDPNGLLPAGRGYYRYSGSLTTPPCSQTVDWLLLVDPIQVADADIARFAKLFPMNARPVQKLDRRFVLRSA